MPVTTAVAVGLRNQLAFGGGLSTTIKNKLLFLGSYSSIVAGKMPNELGSDWITVSGDTGNESYQCPDNSTYRTADADLLWFNFDTTIRSVSTADAIGSDFSRTLVKYSNTLSSNVEVIAIMKSGVSFSSDEKILLYKYFKLPIFWDGTLSFYGYLKYNRGFSKKVWSPALDFPQLLMDGNTLAYYDSTYLPTITKDGGNLVSLWKDKLGSGRDLVQSTGGAQPTWSSSGVTTASGKTMKTGSVVKNQPFRIYIVYTPNSWSNGASVYGLGGSFGLIHKYTTPNVVMSAGSGYSTEVAMTLGTTAILRCLHNGVACKIQKNSLAPISGNWGSTAISEISIGASGSTIKEIIIRSIIDTASDEQVIYDYLKLKYSL